MPETVVKSHHLKPGTKIEMKFKQGELVLQRKEKVREGWADAFAQYARNEEDTLMIPDYIDLETDCLLKYFDTNKRINF